MARSLKLILSEYIVNEYGRMESDVMEAEKNIRWGKYCSHDLAHLQLLLCRFETFKDIANNIMIYCKISEDDIVDYVHSEFEKNKL